MEKTSVYIVLSRPRTVVSDLIYLVTKDTYTHAAISFDKELRTMYSFGRKYPYNPFYGRFKKEELDEGLYKRLDHLPGAVIELTVTQAQYDKAWELLSEFLTHPEKYKYNYLGLMDHLQERAVCRENRFVCSEFVYYILHNSGILDLGVSPNLVRPQTFLQVPGNLIYEGNLKYAYPSVHRSRTDILAGSALVVE